jgi:RHS repeat-associated protein
VIAETDTLGNVQAWYIYGLGLAYKLMPDGNIYTYHFDSRGSTIAMTDGTGQIVNQYSYGPYGERLNMVEGTPNPFGYVGRYGVMEEGNGLKFMRARYYDETTGRFLNEDLIQGYITKPQSLNRYAYVRNNPINWIDPPGLYPNQMPPPPPGYNPETWPSGVYPNGNYWVLDPADPRDPWVAHPEDDIHWRHWDKTPKGGPHQRLPEQCFKPGSNKKALQSPADPNGDTPGWAPNELTNMDPYSPENFYLFPMDPLGFPVPGTVPGTVPGFNPAFELF